MLKWYIVRNLSCEWRGLIGLFAIKQSRRRTMKVVDVVMAGPVISLCYQQSPQCKSPKAARQSKDLSLAKTVPL